MGKCTSRKAVKEIPLTEVSQSFLGGVRTRAKTLALQRLRSSSAAVDYLELRSRRLEKPPLLTNYQKRNNTQKQFGEKENSFKSGEEFAIGLTKKGFEIEASLGENDLDLGNRERSTRESTPSSLIRPADTITAPGSSTKLKTPISARQRNILGNIPPAQEIEEFFAHLEQTQQRRFIEKYNFDVVNDMPLPGRYEWVKVTMP